MLTQGGRGIQGHLDSWFHINGDEVFHPTGKQGVRDSQTVPAGRRRHLEAVHDETMIHAGGPIESRPQSGPRDGHGGDVDLNGCGGQVAPGGGKPAVTVDET